MQILYKGYRRFCSTKGMILPLATPHTQDPLDARWAIAKSATYRQTFS